MPIYGVCQVKKPGSSPDGSKSQLLLLGILEMAINAEGTEMDTQAELFVLKGNAENLLSCDTAVKLDKVKFAESNGSPLGCRVTHPKVW